MTIKIFALWEGCMFVQSILCPALPIPAPRPTPAPAPGRSWFYPSTPAPAPGFSYTQYK